jgi:hypothetical protein
MVSDAEEEMRQMVNQMLTMKPAVDAKVRADVADALARQRAKVGMRLVSIETTKSMMKVDGTTMTIPTQSKEKDDDGDGDTAVGRANDGVTNARLRAFDGNSMESRGEWWVESDTDRLPRIGTVEEGKAEGLVDDMST